jgi:hypothetical protein
MEGSLLSFMNTYEILSAAMLDETSTTFFFLAQLFCQHERRTVAE